MACCAARVYGAFVPPAPTPITTGPSGRFLRRAVRAQQMLVVLLRLSERRLALDLHPPGTHRPRRGPAQDGAGRYVKLAAVAVAGHGRARGPSTSRTKVIVVAARAYCGRPYGHPLAAIECGEIAILLLRRFLPLGAASLHAAA